MQLPSLVRHFGPWRTDRISPVICGFCVAFATCLSWPASAAVIKGSFTGIAFNSRIDALAPWHSNFDGQTVTGSFWFDPYNQPINGPDEVPGSFHARDGSMRLVFHAAGQTAAFDTEMPSFVDYKTEGPNEHLLIGPSTSYPYYNAILFLTGPLFANESFESLHAAPVDLARSWAYFFAGRPFGADVKLTRVTFDVAPSVPEPSVFALVLGGLLCLIVRQRASRKKRADWCFIRDSDLPAAGDHLMQHSARLR